jgi:hypothetical protein
MNMQDSQAARHSVPIGVAVPVEDSDFIQHEDAGFTGSQTLNNSDRSEANVELR